MLKVLANMNKNIVHVDIQRVKIHACVTEPLRTIERHIHIDH